MKFTSPLIISLTNKANKMKTILPILLFSLVVTASAISQERIETKSSDLVPSAKAFVDLLVKKDFKSAVGYYDATMKKALPEDKLKEAWSSLITQAGAFKRQTSARIEYSGGYSIVFVTCEFEKASIDIKVVFDKEKRIAGFFFTPATPVFEYSPPGYVKKSAFSEREVTVGSGEWTLPGTLTMPVGKGAFPAVVLVQGSGPNDRDETVGQNKPFRDLAWGLASQGIAVLRYEKRTRQYGAKISQLKSPFTVKEETIDDALAAVALLRKTEGVDAGKIFVLGHSLGGMLVPRIGAEDTGIAGFIVMAGATQPLEDEIVRQTEYIYSLEGNITKEMKSNLEEIKKQVSAIKNLKPSDVSSTTYFMGAPTSYWLDLKGYNPPEAAKKLKQPLFILQGERDYQVTMSDFQKWKNALSSRRDVTFKSYPKLNHLFMEGKGKSSPEEYNSPGHVAQNVIQDISIWIKR
jgi:uncharacterized protein